MDEIIYRCPDFSEYLLARGATGDFSIDRLSYECQLWWYCFIVVGLFVWLTGCMTVCLGAFLYVCLYVCVSAIFLSVCIYVCLCMYICLNVRMSVRLSRFVCLPVCVGLYLSHRRLSGWQELYWKLINGSLLYFPIKGTLLVSSSELFYLWLRCVIQRRKLRNMVRSVFSVCFYWDMWLISFAAYLYADEISSKGSIECLHCCLSRLWASYQIRKIAGCACAGNDGNVFPAADFKGNR